jgi:hypothetical protein
MFDLTDAERAEVSALWLKALGLTGAYTIYQAGMRAGIERVLILADENWNRYWEGTCPSEIRELLNPPA